jgi:hypothetical protein
VSNALPDGTHCHDGGQSPKVAHFLLQNPRRQACDAHDESLAHATPVFFPSRAEFHVPAVPSCFAHESLHVSSFDAQHRFRQ